MTKETTSKPWPFPTTEHHPETEPALPKERDPTEDALDHGIEESFPASDPTSVTIKPTEAPDQADEASHVNDSPP